VVTDPAALADILVHKAYDFEKPPNLRAFLRMFLGDGLLMSEGDDHKHQRKLINPSFAFRHIKGLYPMFWAKTREMCNVVKAELAETADQILEIGHFSTLATLDIIGQGGLGRDIGSPEMARMSW
jgi:cytochrome P450